MLTRLRVNGFKNLFDVDIRFGPFTCVAGGNGVGKSNLFDAIVFLSELAQKSLNEAVLSVRDAGNLGGDLRSVFFSPSVGGERVPRMWFCAEMILPEFATDELGQRGKAATTFVEYELELKLAPPGGDRHVETIEIVREELRPVKIGEVKKRVRFPFSKEWRTSAIKGRRGTDLISTQDSDTPYAKVMRHQDGGSGRSTAVLARHLPRTVLSTVQAAENPTALVARREMESWRLLQLEPSRLRKPDDYYAPPHLDASGRHLPATLYRLDRSDPAEEAGASLAVISNGLSDLVRETRAVRIDRDDSRRITTVYVEDRQGNSYPAHALSDGTLRFLALLTIDLDEEDTGLLCLEEPENGMHPERVPVVLELLQRMATEPVEAIGADNPLRQVVINSHSPLVVERSYQDDLVVVDLESRVIDGAVVRVPTFKAIDGTWRQLAGQAPIALATLRRYLGAVPRQPPYHSRRGAKRVADLVQARELPFG